MTFATHNPPTFIHTRPFLCAVVAVAFLLAGCGTERAQVASDQHARLVAAQANLDEAVKALPSPAPESMAALNRAAVNIHNADLSLEAGAEVPAAQWPAPKITAEDLTKHPETDKPSTYSAWTIAAAIPALMGGLFILGRIAPAIPGLGTAVGGIANIAWSLLAQRQQKAADMAKDTIHDYAPELQAALMVAKEGNMVRVPPQLDAAVAALVKT